MEDVRLVYVWCGTGTSPPVNPACRTTRVVLEARRFCEPA